jgi:hypothetical protein
MKSITLFLILFTMSGVVWADEKKPYFQISSSEKREMVRKAATIQIGDSYESVVSKLGKPTYDQVLMEKKGREIIGRGLKFYASIWEKGSVNILYDQLISVFLDPEDRVKNVSIKIILD